MLKGWIALICAIVLTAAGVVPAQQPPDIRSYLEDDLDWVVIGDPGNPAYPGGPEGELAGRGSVDYVYRISRLEVTSAQWLEFINIFAPQSDNHGGFLRPSFSGIRPVPGAPSGVYELDPYIENAAMVPVYGLTWREVAYYVNWLHNDKSPEWDAIMSGAYDASTFGDDYPYFTDQQVHSPGAKFWIPTIDEWLKAGYYDPNMFGNHQGGWWSFPGSSDIPLIPGVPGEGETSAGEFETPLWAIYFPLGSYPYVQSPWGLLDVSGGAREWLEDVMGENGPEARRLAGTWAGCTDLMLHQDEVWRIDFAPPGAYHKSSIRVVGVIPPPGSITAAPPPASQ